MQKMLALDVSPYQGHPMTDERSDETVAWQLPRMAVADNMDFLEAVPDESIQLIVTSPPYNLGKIYEKKRAL